MRDPQEAPTTPRSDAPGRRHPTAWRKVPGWVSSGVEQPPGPTERLPRPPHRSPADLFYREEDLPVHALPNTSHTGALCPGPSEAALRHGARLCSAPDCRCSLTGSPDSREREAPHVVQVPAAQGKSGVARGVCCVSIGTPGVKATELRLRCPRLLSLWSQHSPSCEGPVHLLGEKSCLYLLCPEGRTVFTCQTEKGATAPSLVPLL